MFHKTHTWKRWSGQRSDIIEACNLASSELGKWNSFPSQTVIEIEYTQNLKHDDVTIAQFEQLHESDLQKIEELSIRISADTSLHREKTQEFRDQEYARRRGENVNEIEGLAEPPDLMFGISVTLTFNGRYFQSTGASLNVNGPDRTSVEGLTKGIVEILNRSYTGFTRIRGGAVGYFTWVGIGLGFGIGSIATTLGNHISHNKLSSFQYWVFLLLPPLLFGGLTRSMRGSLPPLEILGIGTPSKFTRMKKEMYAWLAMIVTGVIAIAIWSVSHL